MDYYLSCSLLYIYLQKYEVFRIYKVCPRFLVGSRNYFLLPGNPWKDKEYLTEEVYIEKVLKIKGLLILIKSEIQSQPGISSISPYRESSVRNRL